MKHDDKYLSLILCGYIISAIGASLLFFTTDIKALDYITLCFIAWCGGVFFKAIWDLYLDR